MTEIGHGSAATGSGTMSTALFRWPTEARLYVHGQQVGEGEDSDRAGAQDLVVLRAAIRSGRAFSVGPCGVSLLSKERTGYFHSRSGGTTGAAKTIRRSHASWIASFEVNRNHLSLGSEDRYAVLGVPAHSLALYALVEGAHLGADLHSFAGQRPRQQAQGVKAAQATILYATPTQLRLLCETGAELPCLRHVLCGGGRLTPELWLRIAALCPKADLREFYGAAETSFVAWGDGSGPEGSVGRAYPGVEIRIDAKEGAIGEIWVRSPYLFDGYAEGDSAETRERDGFVTVGELGQLDKEGHLTVAGRRNRMVTIADQNVFPEDIEAFLLSDPAVTHCAVVPRSDPRRGTHLVAVIDGPAEAELCDALLVRCRRAFGPLAAPRRLQVLDEFPLTLSGKPDLAAIARLLGPPA